MRKVIITEEFGLYRLEATGKVVTASTAENVLLKADGGFPSAASFEFGQVIERLLGRRKPEGDGRANTVNQ